ncbi:MAG: asparagine synthase (glutamine-hydrolyzing) [Deltaproteobacteria bacterium RIFOXYD12_FULL_56_24]|nr:MAG: asparagine synthase (glutamine-hydrolyzing) [Deltaproteobacteria bacterium RIFOXYD12_FULL_56_24]
MCGIAGYWGGMERATALELVARMANVIAHRGPDDAGVWVDDATGLALAHRRLSILDLSPAGHQPMVSASGRYVIAFNGEIYNHLDLREALEKRALSPSLPLTLALSPEGRGEYGWRGHSDTETLLAAIAAWGVEETLKQCVGMFAFALWDRETRNLTLARDRLGEKPLYYGWQGENFLFGSELKALREHPAFRGEIDRDALALYMRHNCIPAPYSIHQGIYKLPPGTWLTLGQGERDVRPRSYWSAREVAENGQRNLFSGSEAEAQKALDSVLRQAVAGQMLADVPLGAFLSGGVDSSTVVALMQALSDRPAKTFTIGFHEAGYNEAEHAQAVARHLGTEHTELYVTSEQAMAIIPKLPSLYDEPFADSSQIPTFLVSELARRHVTVSLSGEGGDELFGGYNRYFWAKNIWRRVGWLPQSMRAALAGVLTTLPPSAWNGVFKGLARFLPAGWRYANPGDKLHKLAEILAVRTPEEIYLGLVSHWKHPAEVVHSACEPVTVLTDPARWAALPDLENRMMYLDQMTYLPDDILAKVDRAAMGVSLETRVPLLDHRVVEFAWSLPLSLKIRDGQGKWLLRQVLYNYVPKEMIERPKMGFGIPLDVWLRGPLKDWAETLLDETRLRNEGFFEPLAIRQKWAEHLAGRRNWSYYLWDVLMFQAWSEQWR